MKYCTNCGAPASDDAVFCSSCGNRFSSQSASDTQGGQNGQSYGSPQNQQTYQSYQLNDGFEDYQGTQNIYGAPQMSLFDSATAWISRLAGGSGVPVRPPLKSIFSKIFVKHQKKESEELFICGTSGTTPELSDDGKAWPAPWLWSRIFIIFVATFLLLHICCTLFDNILAYPGLIVIGSFAVPIAVMIFFFELNTPKNICFYTVLKYFLLGGVASLVFTLLLFEIFGSIDDEWLQAMLIGVIEEVGKLGIVVLVIWMSKDAKYALNGLLIGSAIGAGFAAFESAGYAFRILLVTGSYDDMVENILLRGFLAPGGHVIWAAMSGYAVMLVKGESNLSMSFLNQKAFWKIFWIPILLHGVWDMPFDLGESIIVQLIPVTLNMIVGWIVAFVLIGNSLSQIGQILQNRRAEAEAARVGIQTETPLEQSIQQAEEKQPSFTAQ